MEKFEEATGSGLEVNPQTPKEVTYKSDLSSFLQKFGASKTPKPSQEEATAETPESTPTLVEPVEANPLEVLDAIDNEVEYAHFDEVEHVQAYTGPVRVSTSAVVPAPALRFKFVDSIFTDAPPELRVMSACEAKMFFNQERSTQPFSELAVEAGNNQAFILNSRGIYSQRINKNNASPEPLCEPIEPIAIMQKEGGETFVVMRYRDSTSRVREQVIPDIEITNITGENYPGLIVGQKSKHSISTAISLFYRLKKQQSALQIIPCFSRTGWTVGVFSSPEDVRNGDYITSDDARFRPVEAMNAFHGTAGSAAIWNDVARRAVTHSPLFGVVLAYGFSAFAKGVVFTSNVQPNLNLYGEAGKGKSTASALFASLQGPGDRSIPNTPIVDGSSSDASTERLAASNHGLVVLEEYDVRLIKEGRTASAALLNLGNGGGRSRIIRGAPLKNAVVQNTILSNSNDALVDKVKHGDVDKDAALRDRIISLSITDPEIRNDRHEELRLIEEALKEHYGHAIYGAIDILKRDIETYRDAYNAFMREADARRLPVRSSQFLAQLRVGYMLLRQYMTDSEVSIPEEAYSKILDAIEVLEKRAIESSRENLDESVDVKEVLRSFISAHQTKFLFVAKNGKRGRAAADIDCYLWCHPEDGIGSIVGVNEAQKKAARENNQIARRNGTMWGRVEQITPMKHAEDFSGVVIIPAAFAGEISSKTKMDMGRLRDLAATQGCLLDRTTARGVFGEGSVTSAVYCFDLSYTSSDSE